MESLISATTDATTTSGGIKQTLSDLQLFSLSLSDVLSALVLLGICLVVVKLLLRIVDRSFDRLRIDRSLRAFVRSGKSAMPATSSAYRGAVSVRRSLAIHTARRSSTAICVV